REPPPERSAHARRSEEVGEAPRRLRIFGRAIVPMALEAHPFAEADPALVEAIFRLVCALELDLQSGIGLERAGLVRAAQLILRVEEQVGKLGGERAVTRAGAVAHALDPGALL